jgi:6-phosphogluconolactonase
MPAQLYVSLQNDDRIARYALDENSGRLKHIGDVAAPDGPAPMAVHPTGTTLYVGQRGPGATQGGRVDGLPRPEFALTSFAIAADSGELIPSGSRVPLLGEPCFLATDRRGRFLLSACFQAGHCAVHPIAADGALGGDAIEWRDTNSGAHAFQVDPTNRFGFVPHVAQSPALRRLPQGSQTAANAIFQFRFDEETGRLTPNDPPRIGAPDQAGPRHFAFHPTLPLLYVDNEQGSSVTIYTLDPAQGTLTPGPTTSTLPSGFAATNAPSDLCLHPGGRFLYVANRGHNSIAVLQVDAAGGELTPIAWAEAPGGPRTLALDPSAQFLYCGGLEHGQIRGYRIDQATGALTAIETLQVGNWPMWIVIIPLRP